jgi:peptidoglycan/xylan/chitin deacetylase (PgdA/CDA1 family)/glycosyltransferase involved in cell wall biosynthesis
MGDAGRAVRMSVVMPTCNRRHVLERTLPTLYAQDLPASDYELVVVVDGSTDGTAEMLRGQTPRCPLRVLETPRRGAGAARNAGVRAAAGELVLFLDDDFLCPPGLLRQHGAAHAGPEPLLVHGSIFVAPESARTIARHLTEGFYERYYRPQVQAMELRFPADLCSSIAPLSSIINSSVPRATLLAAGGFDERLLVGEDLELGLRLWKMGVRFRSLPAAVVHELYVKSSREYVRGLARAGATADLVTARAHPEYRPHTALSGLAETRWWKRWLRGAVAHLPVSPVPLLMAPFLFERLLYRFAPMRRAGLRVLGYATVIARQRAALRAAGSWRALLGEFGARLPVLLYHHVGPARPGTMPELTVSAERFERHVRWLARRGYVGIRPSEWLRWLRDGTGLPGKPVLFTFDDGYADICEFALPVLRRHGFSAAVFIVSGRLGGTNAWDEAQGSGTHRLMTHDQIRHWAGEGIEFGVHSTTHRDLTRLGAAELAAEVTGGREALARLVGARWWRSPTRSERSARSCATWCDASTTWLSPASGG